MSRYIDADALLEIMREYRDMGIAMGCRKEQIWKIGMIIATSAVAMVTITMLMKMGN